MDIGRLALLVVLLTLVGFITVFQHLKTYRSGYRINELRDKQRLLQEEQRRLELDVARSMTSQHLLARAQALAVPVSLPGHYNVVRIDRNRDDGARTVERGSDRSGQQ